MRLKFVFSAVVSCLVAIFLPGVVPLGEAEDAQAPSSATDEGSESLDAVLMLDASGSMLLTDPQKLRNQGAKLFANSLKEGDRLAIVEFSESAKVIRPLSPFNPKNVDSISRDIDMVQANGIYTDLLKAVKKGKEMLELDLRENATQVVILLSDGKFEPNPKEGSTEALTKQLLDQIIPEARSEGIKFYTLAFSEEADRELLKEIAVGTGGVSWFAKTPEDIPTCYSDLFLVVKKPQLVSMTKAGFKIDEDVKEATFYINKEGDSVLSLLTPDGEVISESTGEPGVHWFSGEKFNVITVKKPKAGNWQVSGISSPDGFATVLTNLKLVTDWPTSVMAGQKYVLQVRLYDAQKPVMISAMADVVQYSYFITPTDRIAEPAARGPLYDDGTHGDKVAKDGLFSAEVMLADVGDYKLRVMARAPTFERNQQMQFRVKPPYIGLSVYHKEAESQALRALMEIEANRGKKGAEKADEDPNIYKERDIIRAQLSDDAKALKSPRVNLLAKDPTGRELIIEMRVSKDSQLAFEIDEFGLPMEGRYELQAVVTGSTAKGKAVQEMTSPFIYEKKSRGGGESAQLVVVEPEKEKQKPSAPSSLLPIMVLTLFNAAAGALAFVLLRKVQEGAAVSMPSFTPISTFSAQIEGLRRRNEKSEVNFDDPMFAGIIPAEIVTGAEGEAAEKDSGGDAVTGEGPEAGAPETGGTEAAQPVLGDIDAELNDLLEDAAGEEEVPEDAAESPGEEEGED